MSFTMLTLDAGGTTFSFSALRDGQEVSHPLVLPSHGAELAACLDTLRAGFERQREACGGAIDAISFAFPGPADYASGIIGDLQNLPAFRGGVPLGPMLEEHFGVPVFINNDGDLFAFGEAQGGCLPEVNAALAAAESPRRYRNLLGLTFGTGFGAGIVSEGRLLLGDNGAAAEIWCTRHRDHPNSFAEEGVSIRAVRRAYAELTGTDFDQVPEPRHLAAIADGAEPGDAEAAREAFRRLGRVAGEAAANAVTLVDGLVVIGGGLSGAWRHFLPAMVAEMNRPHTRCHGSGTLSRTELEVYNLEVPCEREAFLKGHTVTLAVPGSARRVAYDPHKRVGVAISRLGAARAVALGAYRFAEAQLRRA